MTEEFNADVIVVGAGPIGLMLACELCLNGVRPLVLEQRPEISQVPKAGGLSGQILEFLRYRGELGRFEAAGTEAMIAPRIPWGGLHVNFGQLEDSPMKVLRLPQPELEKVMADWAIELGAEIRRGHEVIGLEQDGETVTLDVRSPADGDQNAGAQDAGVAEGTDRFEARYVVGCDGASSRIRELAAFDFPGMTYPEVQRLAEVTLPESVKRLEDGGIEVEGVGRFEFGFHRTGNGEFAVSSQKPGVFSLFTSEEETNDYDDEEPMTVEELAASIKRVIGADIPLGEANRLTRFTFHARQVDKYRDGRVFLAGDAAHLFPSPGVATTAGLFDSINLAWKLAARIQGRAPAGLLDTYEDERSSANSRTMLHTQAQVALRRGHDPAAVALREVFQELTLDESAQTRMARLIACADIRYPDPRSESTDEPAVVNDLTGRFVPDMSLRSGNGMATVAELMRTPRPVLLDLADRADLREVVREWNETNGQYAVEVRTAETDNRLADVILIRPDAFVAGVVDVDEPVDVAVPALRESLDRWFGSS